jgi:dihydrolipoamide dehydrogenase
MRRGDADERTTQRRSVVTASVAGLPIDYGEQDMKERNVDVAIIGAGSAGLAAYRAAARWTRNLVLIEGGTHGTTCARVGCMPSKLLIAAAEAAHEVARAGRFGIRVGASGVDGVAVMDRVRRERDRFVGFVVDTVENIPAGHRMSGMAQFLDDHRLQVGDDSVVNARRIVIATGSSPAFPARLAELGDRLVVNDDIFDWQDLPASVAVFGPGVIGLELGQALHRLGVRVSMFGVGGLVGPLTDPAVRAAARRAFADEFHLDPDALVHGMQRSEHGVLLDYSDPDGMRRETEVEYVVAATGRRPNLSGLGLDKTTLPLDARGIPVFDERSMQIGDTHVFIAGDAQHRLPLLHEAADEGRIAGDNAGRYPRVQPGRRRSKLAIVFSDPQIAMVGASRSELDGRDIVVGEASFEDQGRSRVMLRNEGLLRVYADRASGRFLGAEMVGPRAEHIGHLLAWAHQAELTIAQMLGMPFYHPVVEEGLRTALRDACARLRDCGLRAA